MATEYKVNSLEGRVNKILWHIGKTINTLTEDFFNTQGV